MTQWLRLYTRCGTRNSLITMPRHRACTCICSLLLHSLSGSRHGARGLAIHTAPRGLSGYQSWCESGLQDPGLIFLSIDLHKNTPHHVALFIVCEGGATPLIFTLIGIGCPVGCFFNPHSHSRNFNFTSLLSLSLSLSLCMIGLI